MKSVNLTTSHRSHILKVLIENPFNKKKKEIQDKIQKIVLDYFIKFIPENILVLWNDPKTRKYLNCAESVHIYAVNNKKGKNWLYSFNTGLPFLGDKNKSVTDTISLPDLQELINPLVDEYVELSESHKLIFSKTECVLSSIRSSNKLKLEFPEAFEVLKTALEDQGEVLTDKCTSVEELRAELSKISTK